jgi:hypothetical protein
MNLRETLTGRKDAIFAEARRRIAWFFITRGYDIKYALQRLFESLV